ncbi:helix-turn-helix domain-containing protein [Psychroflexus sp. MBR-150]|jgi:transcriptional regulator with XRE-family HTH domain
MNKIIGKRIKQFRHQKGYSQEHLAHELCISQSAYARLENGETYTWASHLEKLCEIFEVQPEDIVKQESIVINDNQKGGHSNNAYIINQLSEKLIEQYEKRIQEKDKLINQLNEKLKKG